MNLIEGEWKEDQEMEEEGGLRGLDTETVGKAQLEVFVNSLSLGDVQTNGPGHQI